MTRRAMVWCGHAPGRDWADHITSVNDVVLALRAAQALGIPPGEIDLFLCREVDALLGDGHRRHPARAEVLARVAARIAAQAAPDDALLFLARMLELWAGVSHAMEHPVAAPANLQAAWAVVQGEVFPGRGDTTVRAMMSGSAIWP